MRLIASDGEQIGIVPTPEALAQARAAGLDLVEVAENAKPPVCRIMDYGKWKYQNAQKQKESKKKSTHVQVKEMKYRPKIGQGDFDTKTKKVKQFLREGNRVKLTIMFRGREQQRPEMGRKILDDVAAATEDIARVEVYPKLEGPRNMTMVLVPDKEKMALLEADGAAAQADDTASTPDTTQAADGEADTSVDTTDADAQASDQEE